MSPEPAIVSLEHPIVVADPSAKSLKERFRRTMFFQDVAVRPNFEFGYWDETLVVWRDQGLPAWVIDEATAYDYFGIESAYVIEVSPNPLPLYAYEVLEETEDHIVYRDEWGCIGKNNKRGNRTIPHYIDYPIKDRATWLPIKQALDPAAPERWAKFKGSLARCERSDAPIGVAAGSLVGIARNLTGFERMATLPYEDPGLFREMVDSFGATIVAVLERILPRIQVDFAHGWEDICFNHGPIIPPEVYRDVAGPWIRRIADLLTAHGCCIYSTDTDGNINPIVEVMVDNGMNTMFPVEVHAGSDPCALWDRFGKRIRLWGGVDKQQVLGGRAAIDRELDRLRPYVDQGGFIPGFDHRVPADVTLDLYKYYLDRKREVLNVGGEPHY